MSSTAELVSVIEPDLEAVSEELWLHCTRRRGGEAMREELTSLSEPRAYLEDLIAASHLFCYRVDGEIQAYAVLSDGCIKVLVVREPYRRRGVARHFVELLQDYGARDAWALPGDRATKSLYESVGWKARKLTMRGE